jgi:hypothetical protein
LTIGTETQTYAKNLSQHYDAVRARLRMRPKVQNKIKEVLANKAEQDRQFMERRAARYAEWKRRRKLHHHPITGAEVNYKTADHMQRRVDIAKDAEDPKKRLANLPAFPFFDFSEAIDIILTEAGVTWDAVMNGALRDIHTRYARGAIALLMRDAYGSRFAASKAMGIDHTQIIGYEKTFLEHLRENAVFLRAKSCVKHK